MKELEAVREIDFDWTMHIKGIWDDLKHSSSELHKEIRDEIIFEFARLKRTDNVGSPLGCVIVGAAGSGKTHLLGELRREVYKLGGGFILVDMTGVHDFWETILLGYLSSIQQPYIGEKTQYQVLIEHILDMFKISLGGKKVTSKQIVRSLPTWSRKTLEKNSKKIVNALGNKYRNEVFQYRDVIRALLLLNSEDSKISDLGYSWLQGLELSEEDKKAFDFISKNGKPFLIVKALSWIMNLKYPVLLALDQFDAIVTEHVLNCGDKPYEELNEEQKASLSIINRIAGGLMDLRENCSRTLIVAACLETTWAHLRNKALKSSTDRYRAEIVLGRINKSEIAREIVKLRTSDAYKRVNFTPPYSTWPFLPESFETAKELFPRTILQRCEHHRQKCLKDKKIIELKSFSKVDYTVESSVKDRENPLNKEFKAFRKKAPIHEILDEKNEDSQLRRLIQVACRSLLKEHPTPDNVDALVDTEFAGGRRYRIMHARIRLVFREQGDREKHFCIRGLQKLNHRAYQSRLKAAITTSGIDRKLKFRYLVIVRNLDIPKGPKTRQLTNELIKAGGRLVKLTDDEIRTIWALYKMEEKNDSNFKKWLRDKKPVSELSLFQRPLLWLNNLKSTHIHDEQKPVPENSQKSTPQKIRPEKIRTEKIRPDDVTGQQKNKAFKKKSIPIGYQLVGDLLKDELFIPVSVLTKHTVILAGSGSGKTVLLRRLVEEAAILGIPSIIIDSANDLARMGDTWPENHQSRKNDDKNKSKIYHKKTNVIIWTPGREKGNPIYLEPIPDLSTVQDDPDELDQVVAMVRDTLKNIVARGGSATIQMKIGVLSSALRYFAKNGGGNLNNFIELLSDLPKNAGGQITKAGKLAQEMANSLRAQIQIDPLLKHTGTALDPSLLFGCFDESGKTRISVLNLIGLPSIEMQQQVINRLSMTLFTWIKKNPSPVRGLFVIDEAKDFIPSGKSTVCKESLLRLCAQARKYGLGLIFATQEPKSIDHKVIANCSTQFYGRANSLAAIDAVRKQIRLRGGTGDEIPTLPRGRFFVCSENIKPPVKIETPLCLSYHPDNPLTEEEVLIRARDSNRFLAKFDK